MLPKRFINIPTATRSHSSAVNSIPNFKLPNLPKTDHIHPKLITPFNEDGQFFIIYKSDHKQHYLSKQLYSLYCEPYWSPAKKQPSKPDLSWLPQQHKLSFVDIQIMNDIISEHKMNPQADQIYKTLKSRFGELDNFGLYLNYSLFHYKSNIDLITNLIGLYLNDRNKLNIGWNNEVSAYCFGKWIQLFAMEGLWDKALGIHSASLHFNVPNTPLYTKYLAICLAQTGRTEDSFELLKQLQKAKIPLRQQYYLTLFQSFNVHKSPLRAQLWNKLLATFKVTSSESRDRLGHTPYLIRLDMVQTFEELKTTMKWITFRYLWTHVDLQLKFLEIFHRLSLTHYPTVESSHRKYEFIKLEDLKSPPLYLLYGWINCHLPHLPQDTRDFTQFVSYLVDIGKHCRNVTGVTQLLQEHLDTVAKLTPSQRRRILKPLLEHIQENPHTYHSGWQNEMKQFLSTLQGMELEVDLKDQLEAIKLN